MVYVGEGVGRKRHMGGGDWLKTSEYRHVRRRTLKLLKKPSYDIWTSPNWLCPSFNIQVAEYDDWWNGKKQETNIRSSRLL